MGRRFTSRADQDIAQTEPTIFHHTAGHHPNLDAHAGESYAEGVAYAKAIQRSHFANGWIDSGHDFLITRSGFIFEGRHRSIKATQPAAWSSPLTVPVRTTSLGSNMSTGAKRR
jgi:hypothetical protein